MTTYTKRPGFTREEVTNIDSIVYVNSDNEAVGRVSLNGEKVSLATDEANDLSELEDYSKQQWVMLRSINEQLRIMNIHLAMLTGNEIDGSDLDPIEEV
jgi:precorrin-6x reductase